MQIKMGTEGGGMRGQGDGTIAKKAMGAINLKGHTKLGSQSVPLRANG